MRVRLIDPAGCEPERERFDIDALRGERSLMGDVVRLCDKLRADDALKSEFANAALNAGLDSSTKTADKRLLYFLEQASAEISGDTSAASPTDDEIDAAMEICLGMLRSVDS